MSDIKRLTDLQLDVLGVLWEVGAATVAQVTDALQTKRDLATTTVATLLSRLEKYGIVAHRTKERKYVYYAIVTREQVRRSMVSTLVDGLFYGDSAALVSHLLRESEIDSSMLNELMALVETKENEERESDNS